MTTRPKESLTSPVFGIKNKLLRVCWKLVEATLFRFSPVPLFRFRALLLKLFGAQIPLSFRAYPSISVWAPWNLSGEAFATIGPKVIVYNQGHIFIGEKAIISQGAHLCASTHDYQDPLHPLLLSPIRIEPKAWICSDAFIGPGVQVEEGAVIGARAVLMKSAMAWHVYAGNPAQPLKQRNPF